MPNNDDTDSDLKALPSFKVDPFYYLDIQQLKILEGGVFPQPTDPTACKLLARAIENFGSKSDSGPKNAALKLDSWAEYITAGPGYIGPSGPAVMDSIVAYTEWDECVDRVLSGEGSSHPSDVSELCKAIEGNLLKSCPIRGHELLMKLAEVSGDTATAEYHKQAKAPLYDALLHHVEGVTKRVLEDLTPSPC